MRNSRRDEGYGVYRPSVTQQSPLWSPNHSFKLHSTHITNNTSLNRCSALKSQTSERLSRQQSSPTDASLTSSFSHGDTPLLSFIDSATHLCSAEAEIRGLMQREEAKDWRRLSRHVRLRKMTIDSKWSATEAAAPSPQSQTVENGDSMPAAAGPEEAQYDPWLLDNTHTSSLVSCRRYLKAYLALSALLPKYAGRPMCQAVLRARRGECSYALMNYREAIDDCQTSVRLATSHVTATSSLSSSSLPSTCENYRLFDACRTWIYSLIMREEYAAATELYTSLLSTRRPLMSGACATLTTVERALLAKEQAALPAVERFRHFACLEAWPDALESLDAAMPLVEDTPLRTLHAIALLETGRVDAAREVLLPYLPSIPLYQAASPSELSTEERQLQFNVEGHFLLVTVLLAKVSSFCGRAYINIAAVLVQRCLSINPCYAPAITLGNYLVALEDNMSCAESSVQRRNYTDAVNYLTEAIASDPTNRRMAASLYLRRAEVYLIQSRPLFAIEDCTSCIRCDPNSAKAYLTRATAYDMTQQFSDAVADRAMAVHLNPLYEAVLREEEEERARKRVEQEEQAARQKQQQQQRQPQRPRYASHNDSYFPRKENTAAGWRPGSGSRRRSDTDGAGAVPPNSHQGTKSSPFQPPRRPAAPATLYDILEVKKGATVAEIRKQFKRLTLECHPDKVVNEPEEVQLKAVERFKRINNAHGILTDTTKRAEYDMTLLAM